MVAVQIQLPLHLQKEQQTEGWRVRQKHNQVNNHITVIAINRVLMTEIKQE